MAKAGCFFGCLSLSLSFSLCGVCVALSFVCMALSLREVLKKGKGEVAMAKVGVFLVACPWRCRWRCRCVALVLREVKKKGKETWRWQR